MKTTLNILVYSINYAPELTGIGKYNAEMCEWLVKQGHSVRIITAQPYYPDWKVFAGYRTWRYSKEIINGVTVLRCPLWVPSAPTGFKRALHLASFACSSFFRLVAQRSFKPDIIFFIEPTVFTFPGAMLLSKLTGAKPVVHVQDFEVDIAFNLGLARNKFLQRFLINYESAVFKRCSMVSTITENMRRKLFEKGVSEEKAVLFPNWADTENIRPLDYSSPLRAELGIAEDKIVVLYSGNMGEKQGLEIIVEAAKVLHDNPQLLFVMCGTGSFLKNLKKQSLRYGLSSIIWQPLQPLDKLNDLLNLADIHILPQKPDVKDQVMPSKLLGMLASGRPILATAVPDTQLYQVIEHSGLISPPGNVMVLVDNLNKLIDDKELRISLGRQARQYAELYFAKEIILTRYLSCLRQIVG